MATVFAAVLRQQPQDESAKYVVIGPARVIGNVHIDGDEYYNLLVGDELKAGAFLPGMPSLPTKCEAVLRDHCTLMREDAEAKAKELNGEEPDKQFYCVDVTSRFLVSWTVRVRARDEDEASEVVRDAVEDGTAYTSSLERALNTCRDFTFEDVEIDEVHTAGSRGFDVEVDDE